MKKIMYVFAVALLITACHPEGRVFVEHQELSPEVEWLKKDQRTFKVPIDNTTQTYNLSLSFRYANGFQYEAAHVKVIEVSPSGVETENTFDLTVRNSDGSYIGEAGYDIWDSEHLIVPNKTYSEKGEYTYIIEHDMPSDPLNFAMEIGVILDEVK